MSNLVINILNECIENPSNALWPDNGVPWKAWDWHVISLCVPGFILCVVFFYLGIKFRYNRKASNITLFLTGLFLALFELYKQISYNRILGFNFINGYNFGVFPWQICSIPMFVALFMPLVKKQSHRDVLIAFMGVYAMLGGFAALFINQQGLFSWHDIGIYIHTITWHLVLMMLGCFSIANLQIGKGKYTRNLKVVGISYAMLVFFSFIAQGINFFVPLYYGVDSCEAANTNMWYISMWYPTNVMILKDIQAISPGINGYGWILAYVLYMIGLFLGDLLVISIYFGIYKLSSYILFKRKARRLEMNR